MTDMTRIGGATPKVDFSVKHEEVQQKDRGGVSGFMGRVWNALTRTPEQKNENRLGVQEYVSQVAARFGVEAAREVAFELSGHLLKGNPLSSHRVGIINAKLEQQHGNPSPAERLAGGIARICTGTPKTDLGGLLASPCKAGGLQVLREALGDIRQSLAGKTPDEQREAIAQLKQDVISHLQSNGLEVDPVTFKATVLEPILEGAGIVAPEPEAPKVEPPKVEPPKVEAPKVEAPKVEPPKVEMQKAPAPEQPKVEKAKVGPTRDLTTPQTERGERTIGGKASPGALGVALGCSSAMVIAQATKSESTVQTLMPKLEKRMDNFFGSLQAYVNRNDLGDKDLKALGQLYMQMRVGFSPEEGGIGRFAKTDEWQPKWTDKDPKDVFKAGSKLSDPVNQEALSNLKSMLTYFKENTHAHIGDDRSVHEKDLRGVQFNAICGMVINDILLEGGMDKRMENGVEVVDRGARNMLESLLVGKDKVFSEVPTPFQKSVRGSPLMAEFANDKIAEGMKGAILDKLMPGLSPDDRKLMMESMGGPVLGSNLDHTSGIRGRFAGANAGIAQDFSQREKLAPLKNCMDLPDKRLDDKALDTVAGLTGSTDSFESVKELVDTIHTTDLLGHKERPVTVQRQWTLPTRFKEGMEDVGKLVGGIALAPRTFKNDHERELYARFEQARTGVLGDPNQLNALKGDLNGLRIPQKTGTGVHTLESLVNQDSVTKLIHKYDLRTLCSISGTTTDISLSLMAQMPRKDVEDIMVPLVRIANGEQGVEIPQKARDLFTSISFFMQSGQYHTPAEVLGGMFLAGIALQGDPPVIDPNNVDALKTGYGRLLEGLAKDPEKFFSVPSGDQQNFKEAIQGQTREVRELQLSEIRGRLEGGQTSFEEPLSRRGVRELA